MSLADVAERARAYAGNKENVTVYISAPDGESLGAVQLSELDSVGPKSPVADDCVEFVSRLTTKASASLRDRITRAS